MLGRRSDGDQRLRAIWLHPGKTFQPSNNTRRGFGEPLRPFLFTEMVAVDPGMPFKAKQSLVEDDVARGFGITRSDIDVLNRRRIVIDDEEGHFGYVVGDTKFDPTRHNESGRVQILYLFGIAPDNGVRFFGQFKPVDMALPPLGQDEARQIYGLKPFSNSDLVCTAIELVEDCENDLQTSTVIRQALERSEKIGGGLFSPT